MFTFYNIKTKSGEAIDKDRKCYFFFDGIESIT